MDKVNNYFGTIVSSIQFGWVIFAIFIVEFLSYAVFQIPEVNLIVFGALVVGAFVLSLYRLKYGLWFLFIELFIGSKGYLFSTEIAGFDLSIRLALFLVVFVAYLVWIIRERRIAFFYWDLWREFTAFVTIIAFGVLIGVLRGNALGTIFFDVNGYLYMGLIGPLTQVVRRKKDIDQFIALFLAAMVALGIKTLFLLALFSQIDLFPYTLPGVYQWVRGTGVGEITRFENGFSRIFFQSHIYMLFLFFFLSAWIAFTDWKKDFWKDRLILSLYLLWALSILVIFLSYSRSYWVAAAGGLILLSVWLFVREKLSFKKLLLMAVLLTVTFAFDYVVAFGIVNIPLPGNVGVGAKELLTDRTKNLTDEPAAATRWQALEPLSQAVTEHPVFGSGLGSTVTYQSSDPRVLQDYPDGWYTTYAFEWGYLDLLLKFGIVGFAVYLYLFYRMVRFGAAHMKKSVSKKIEVVGALAALLSLLLTHVFTPYLNHPLGIGWILLVAMIVTIPHVTDPDGTS